MGMTFTFGAYKNLIQNLRENGYQFSDYHNYDVFENPCILRHDIDCSLDKALCFAKIESDLGVKSTYFVLIASDFYNVLSVRSKSILSEIKKMGHEIGLHFDETAYGELNDTDMVEAILEERNLLETVVRGG